MPGCMSRELSTESRSLMWLDDFRRDVAYGLRTLLRTPGFTVVAVLTLAVGISAVTVIYSVLRNVALDPFPYSRSDRLVNVVLRDGSGRIIRGPYFRSDEFLDYQEQTTAFEDVVGTSQFTRALDERCRRRAPGAQLDDAERLRLSRRPAAASAASFDYRGRGAGRAAGRGHESPGVGDARLVPIRA